MADKDNPFKALVAVQVNEQAIPAELLDSIPVGEDEPEESPVDLSQTLAAVKMSMLAAEQRINKAEQQVAAAREQFERAKAERARQVGAIKELQKYLDGL